ncbi:unnamed protein product [Rotaria sp. Silwood2]|nr:unnamed protein product [Rotaria sp. Silwood2]
MAEENKTVAIYLSLSQDANAINMEHLRLIRSIYQDLTKVDDLDDHEIDEKALDDVCQQLNLSKEGVDREYLRLCVKYDDIHRSKMGLKALDQTSSILANNKVNSRSTPSEASSSTIPKSLNNIDINNRNETSSVPQQQTPPVVLNECVCVLSMKMDTEEIQDFISNFLFQQLQKQSSTTNNASASDHFRQSPQHSTSTTIVTQDRTKLPFGCVLDLFIRHQLENRGIISFVHAQTRFRLVEPISLTDDFSTWHFDHFHDLFDIWLKPCSTQLFPKQWRFADNGQIYYQVNDAYNKINDDTETMTIERPNTSSLESFIRDICLKENNGMTDVWLKQLRELEDIITYSHLANLKETDWNGIVKLSMNAKKTIKKYVDREKQTADDEKRKTIAKKDENQNEKEKQGTNILFSVYSFSFLNFFFLESVTSYSKSELLANLHMIKLFFYHSLKDNFDLKQSKIIAKLNPECVELSFNEIREEGFSDDGLFDNMKEFFLPLTITEHELKMERHNHQNLRKQREEEQQTLIDDIKSVEYIYNEHVSIYWTYDENLTMAQKELHDEYLIYIRKKSEQVKNINRNNEHEQAQFVQQLDQEWKEREQKLEQNISEHQQFKDDIDKVIKDYERQLDEKRNQLKNVQFELNKKQKVVHKKLVKPHRGFIMFGPPGTGKSEIMSKLATKIGIQMVGPPLAAGELNRPLVGESERIIIALCTRCNRIPYTQCCVSIDEIDSLAPKRDEDSSEGKVDKISVLLSLIEGIKDIPNLMIFCATNRLHMMDEAFLRRMSGKFFVGRPSSEARRNILSQIPDWALEPDMLERLTIATTNFSGAAVGYVYHLKKHTRSYG